MAQSRREALTAGLALAFAAPAAGLAAASKPDDKLLALCGEYVALDRQFVALGEEQGDRLSSDPVWKALDRKSRVMVPELHRLEQEISDLPARTLEGVKVKARATRHMLSADADGDDGPMNDEASMAWSLVEDLLRVA